MGAVRTGDGNLITGLQVAEVIRGDSPVLFKRHRVGIDHPLDAERRGDASPVIASTGRGDRVEPKFMGMSPAIIPRRTPRGSAFAAG